MSMTGLQFLAGVANDIPLGYVNVVKIGDSNIGVQTNMASMNTNEVADFTQKNLTAYYKIGEYWYVVI